MNHKTRLNVTQWSLIALFGIVSLLLVTGGYLFYRREERAIRSEKYHELHAIAELKVNQIIEWRSERIGDARRNSSGYFFRAAFNQWLESPGDAALQAGILANMKLIRTSYGYDNVILTGVDGRILLSLDPRLTKLDAYAQQLAAQAVASGDVVFGDFFRCLTCEQVHLDVIAPILDADGHPAAVLILRVDPEEYLYPLIQTWPTPSRSAETLLVRQDGADVLFLNTLRHRPDPALTLRIPLSQADVPAVRAALGQIGKAEGQDYRGAPVLADVRPVPGSSWFIVAKVDMDEILAEVHYRGRAILLFVSLSVLLAGAMAAFVFSYRQRQLYQNLFRAERERREAQEEIRATLYGIGDGVIAADAAGRVTRMNPVAEQLTGWREAEALGKPLEQVFRIVNEDSRVEVENPVGRVLREGLVVGLANHTLLIARDGVERPIADSGAPIRDERGEVAGVVLVFRDQTEERAAQRALHESEEKMHSIFRAAPTGIGVVVNRVIAEVNQRFCDMIGYAREELVGQSARMIYPSDAEYEYVGREKYGQIAEQGTGTVETRFRRKDGAVIDVLLSSTPIDTADLARGVTFTALDITERKQAEEQLRYQAILLANVNDAIIASDAQYRLTAWNAAAESLYGWKAEQVLGRSGLEIVRTEWPGVDADEMRRTIAETGRWRGEVTQIRQDGARIPVDISSMTLRDESGQVIGYVSVNRDITARKQAEEALRESEERYRLIAEHVNDIVWQLDKDLRFVYVSPAVENILGYSVQETHQLPVVSLLDSEGIAQMQQVIQSRVAGGQESSVTPTEYKMRRKDGRWVDVEVVSAPIFDQDGRHTGFAGVTRDITARKQAEEETRQRLVELEVLHRASQQLLAARLDPEETYAAVHQAVAQVMPCEAFIIVLEDKPTDEYHAVYLFDKGGHCPPQRIPRGQSLSGRVIASGETLLVDDFTPASDFPAVHFGDPEHVRSILATPLRSGEQVVGMLSTQSYRPHAYEERQRLLLETLAAQFAAAIQNAFLYQQWQARLRELEVMASVSAALRKATTRAEMPPLILDRLLLLLGVEGAALEMFDPISGALLVDLGRGVWQAATGQTIPPGAGLSAEVLASRRPYLNNAAHQDPRLFRPELFGECRAAAAAPLAVQGQIIGLLWIGSRRPLTDLDLRLLTAVADIAANAIHRTALQEQIAAQARQTAQIMDSVPEGVLLLDASGRVLLANPVAERHLAALAEASIGERLAHLGERPLAELLTSPPKGLWHEVRAGAQVFEVIARPVADGSHPEHWVLVLHDATQERQVRGQLQQQERLAAVGQLAAGIAHDFNNIMGIILLQARLAARSESLSDQDQERLATISQQVHHAARLIQQILDFSRQAALERQPLDLLPLLKEQIKLLERTLPEHIEIRFVYGRGEYTVSADPTRMQQMVMNLAVNARDAMPEGGVLRIALERVTVEPGASPLAPELAAGEWIRLTVADSGAGIPPQALPHIFEPFYTTKAPGKGSGLGLAQVHGIVGQHEGRIEVQTQVGAGTTFTVYLPALPAPAVAWSAPELGEIPQGQGEIVLVVEDDALLRAALRETLELWNYQVQEAAHGAEALALLAESGTRIDVVVSDVVMPTMGGVALVHALREQGWDLPVILLSGHPQEKEFAELRAHGVRAWLSKPPALDQLARAVAGAVQTQPPD
jgi:PAS domain S-box-containing protein